MKKTWMGAMILAVAVALLAAPAARAEEGTWTDDDENHFVLHEGGDMIFVGEEGGDTFDLGELLDGETRTFGEGTKQVTVTREGDGVVIERADSNEGNLELRCTLGQDTCQVVTFADDPEKVMIIVKKTRECINGVGDCDATIDLDLESLGDGANVHAIVKKVKCDDAGNCEEFENAVGSGELKIITDVHRGLPHEDIMILSTDDLHDDQVTLRCPEGDATVRVDAEEAEDTFLCPQHALKMEKSSGPVIHKLRVTKED